MSKRNIAISGAIMGLVMAFGFAGNASAVTVAELQAQINALMAQLTALQGGSTVSTTFTQNLTVGSSGAEVTALQQMLVAQGHLTMPQGVAYGYFGNLTKLAVAKWQAANGVSPAAGYWGALSRAKAASMGATGGSTTGGTTTGGTTVTGSISTPGAEGTMTVTSAPVSTSNYYEGDQKVAAYAFNVKAQGSDLSVQRVKLDLGTNTKFYNKAFSKVYLVDDAGSVLASSDLNSSTVVKDGSNYYITITGFSSIVKKDTTRVYTVKLDVRSSVDTADRTGHTIALPVNGVRAVDGAGIDLYAPATALASRSLTISAELAESASLTLSADASNPLDREIVAAAGTSEDEADKVVLLTFNLKADKDDVKVTDLAATVTRVAGTATASTTYLYEGSGVGGRNIATASAGTAGAVAFADIDYVIPKGTTKTFTLAADIRSAGATQTTIDSSIGTITAENSLGDSVSATGSAAGNNVLVRNIGPEFTLIGTPTIVKTQTPLVNNYSTSTVTATFVVDVKAVGSDIYVGDTASTTGQAFVEAGTNGTFNIYANGTAAERSVASSTSVTLDSNFVASGSNNWKLAEGSTGRATITFSFQGNQTTGVGLTFGNYSVGIKELNWGTATALNTSTYMSSLTTWRTPTVSLP